ncbi:MAG: FAD-dependent oxidoreductase, partial [Flavobacteriia bacterium]|nr:FAD-dependent oxidoreductase [Flavobacteriia bacterium]
MAEKVNIIGGGIVGLSCAYALVKKGYSVCVIDPKTDASGASFVNAGYLTPSHIMTIASPGMIKKGLKWMWNSSSPFYVKPRFNIDFLKWSWKFFKSASSKNVTAAIKPIKEINLLSEKVYREILTSGDLGDFMLEDKGLLMLHKTQKAASDEGEVLSLIHI